MQPLARWSSSLVAALLLVALGAAVAVLTSACGGATGSPATVGTATVESHPAPLLWETRDYRTEKLGIGLTVHAFSLKYDYIGVLYSVDHASPDLSASPVNVALTDDLGQEYAVANHSILGTALGVTAGVLIVEPYKGETKTLTLTVTDATVTGVGASSPQTIPGTWSVTFIENRNPGAPIDYQLNGKIAPEVVSVRDDLALGKAGGPEIGFVKLLIDRGGKQTALYGRVSDGVAQPLDEAEFRQLATYDPVAPHTWPAPAAVP